MTLQISNIIMSFPLKVTNAQPQWVNLRVSNERGRQGLCWPGPERHHQGLACLLRGGSGTGFSLSCLFPFSFLFLNIHRTKFTILTILLMLFIEWGIRVWIIGSEDNSWESVFSFNLVGLRDQTWVTVHRQALFPVELPGWLMISLRSQRARYAG